MMVRILDAIILPIFLGLAWFCERRGYVKQATDLRDLVAERRADAAAERAYLKRLCEAEIHDDAE